jgi:CDP-glycerol glycerophosphotransferase (TagB/SpsB family)/GT2 family glycosyltransferase
MGNDVKLSVVVIAFNNELYIEEALQSLHEQTFDNFDVVVVNDASTDRTGELIEKFIVDKPKFKVIHLENNSGGCSVPRNTGIKYSNSDYVMFLDGDDWYAPDACEKMVTAIERTGSDFVAGQVIRTNNYEIWYHKQIYSKERIDTSIREFREMFFDSLSVNKIYKRSFLDQHQLRFPEGIHYEDVVFTGKAYFLAKSISIIPEPIYYWRVVENAAVKSITNRRFDFDNFKNRIIANRMFDRFLRENGDILYLENKNNKFLRHDLKLYTNDYLSFDDDYKEKFHDLIREYMHEVMDEYAFFKLSEKDRIMYYLLYIGDKMAFEDYISYINNMPTKKNRIYCIGDKYYFKSDLSEKYNEKFLSLKEPKFFYQVSNLLLSENSFTFECRVDMPSVSKDELNFYWELYKKSTKEVISSDTFADNHFSFKFNELNLGNYYLNLVLFHKGNTYKKRIHGKHIQKLANLKMEVGVYSIMTHLTPENHFALKVSSNHKGLKVKRLYKKFMGKIMIKNKLESLFRKKIENAIKKFPVKSNWVFFESHMGKQYSDSPKYIYEELLKNNTKFKYIWSFEKPDTVVLPKNTIKVKKNSLKHFYYLNRSKYWVDNQGMAHLTTKKSNQVYLQTWHGTPLKKMGYDQKVLPNEKEFKKLSVQTKAWNYFISPNRYSTDIFKRSFRYSGKIVETGYPRNDILVNQPVEIINKVKSHYQISTNKRVVLFAPTFRDWDKNSFQKTYNDIQLLSKQTDENTYVLLRLHYLLSDKLKQLPLPKNVIDASDYQDIQELYLISDMLITDYSSVMFDYALLQRPIIFYCYDLEEYVTKRGLYLDYNKLPGPICKTMNDVIEFVTDPSKLLEYNALLKEFKDEFGSLEDGKSSLKIIEKVFNHQ